MTSKELSEKHMRDRDVLDNMYLHSEISFEQITVVKVLSGWIYFIGGHPPVFVPQKKY